MSIEINNNLDNFYSGLTKVEIYQLLIKQLPVVFEGETNFISNAANFSSLLFNSLSDINWVGFYFITNKTIPNSNTNPNSNINPNFEKELVLGPFMGKTACVRISIGKGVCGTSAHKMETIIVEDVHNFEGHIACDANSNSEIVIPIIVNGKLIGVLDSDSPIKSRFDIIDKQYLTELLNILTSSSEVEKLYMYYNDFN